MNGERVVFRYKPMLGRLSPTATIGLCLYETWRRVDFYVDSGAAYSIVHGDFARDAGFDFERGERSLVKVGDGSLIPVFLHRVPVQIGPHRIEARLGGFFKPSGHRLSSARTARRLRAFPRVFPRARAIDDFRSLSGAWRLKTSLAWPCPTTCSSATRGATMNAGR